MGPVARRSEGRRGGPMPDPPARPGVRGICACSRPHPVVSQRYGIVSIYFLCHAAHKGTGMRESVPEIEKKALDRVGRRGGRPTHAEAQRRRQHLIEVAGVMFMKHGFDGISMDAVAEAAG